MTGLVEALGGLKLAQDVLAREHEPALCQILEVVIEKVGEMLATDGEVVLYEKCADCHLFVAPNDVDPVEGMELAEYVHLHRGTEDDERLDENHEAKPSGEKRTLDYWKEHGPPAMRARFVR